MPREKGGQGLISRERCVQSKNSSVGWYVRNSNGGQLLERVRRQVKSWSEKKMYSQFLRQLEEEGADINGTWNLLKKADLKSSTKTFIRVA